MFTSFQVEDHRDQFLALVGLRLARDGIPFDQYPNEYIKLAKTSLKDIDLGSLSPTDGAWTLMFLCDALAILPQRSHAKTVSIRRELLSILSTRSDPTKMACKGAHDNFALSYYFSRNYGAEAVAQFEDGSMSNTAERKAFEVLRNRYRTAIETLE